jgi:hypothetical protein
MPDPAEEKEVRAQRHDFIKEYYKMATADLDRHLKGGWQTIAVLAGGAAILTAGHDQKIGLPIATSIALASGIWGALTVIDANYWSLRAIGFLANVEAFYLSVPDREYLNPYVGQHPPYKLLDSLRYLFWLCIFFGLVSLADMFWEVRDVLVSNQFLGLTKSRPALEVALWCLPILIAAWGAYWIFKDYLRRLRDYRTFSVQAEGPGVRNDQRVLRHITLAPLTGGAEPELEENTQSFTHRGLDRGERLMTVWLRASLGVAALVTLGCFFVLLYRVC